LACDNLSEEQWDTPTACPGWSVRDQLSHLIGIERSLEGESVPEWPGALGPHVKTPFAEGNEKWIAVRRDRPGDAVLGEFIEVTDRRLATLGALGEEEWAQLGPSPVGNVPYAEFMRVRVFDSWVHEQDARLALGRPGGTGGGASDIAIAQVQGAMGFVVGKRAAAPEGTVVCFSLTGPALDARQLIIAVEGGRAREVPPGPHADGDAGSLEPGFSPTGLWSGDGGGRGDLRAGRGRGGRGPREADSGGYELHVLTPPERPWCRVVRVGQ
jgi:uncharacterized protein (TIGR03083 family)